MGILSWISWCRWREIPIHYFIWVPPSPLSPKPPSTPKPCQPPPSPPTKGSLFPKPAKPVISSFYKSIYKWVWKYLGHNHSQYVLRKLEPSLVLSFVCMFKLSDFPPLEKSSTGAPFPALEEFTDIQHRFRH